MNVIFLRVSYPETVIDNVTLLTYLSNCLIVYLNERIIIVVVIIIIVIIVIVIVIVI